MSLLVLFLALGLVAVGTPAVGAQTPAPNQNVAAIPGTCADLGMSVVEPNSVNWQSDSDPVLHPRYQWAYGDVDLLWDNSVDEYWFHWYDAVPGADPYVVYQFDADTSIEGVQFTNDWSSGDLQLQGLAADGQPAAGLHSVHLDDPFESHVASLDAMTVASIRMTTSTQQVKLLELDFCGGGAPQPELDLVVSASPCEVISATWTPQSGADHQVTVVDSNSTQVDSQTGLTDSYGPVSVAAGAYTITLVASSPVNTVSETATVAVDDCGSPTCDPMDAYCDSVNVIDSFGDAPLPAGADSGMQWHAVREYYNDHGDRPGMCSIDVHNSYWTSVRSADGGLTHYPSWHPPVHDPGGPQECRFTHEHGLDPRTSDLYDEDSPTNIGVPFGFVHSSSGSPMVDREDHVGHKVVVWNDFQLTSSNPYHGADFTLNLYEPDGVPITCDWYSKLHQGTHSRDALGFNLHEYFLNYSCDDGTEVRIKELTSFGFPDDDNDGQPIDSPDFSLTGGSGATSGCDGWFRTNLPGPASDPDPSDDSDFGDAGRGFTCLMNNGKIEELWKPSATVRAPDGAGSVDYDPYYVVMNSNRYAINDWWEFLDQDGDHVGENAMISMVDFCVDGSELRNELSRSEAPGNFVKQGDVYPGQFRIHTYCESIDASVLAQWEQDIVDAGGDSQQLMDDRKFSIDNPFIGTRRGVHTKGPVVYGRNPNFGELAFFCSDHLGNDPAWPVNPDTGASVTVSTPWQPGEPTPVCSNGVSQIVSTFFNKHWAVEGSNAGADPGNQSNGPGSEITIDIDDLYPNHGVQAPN